MTKRKIKVITPPAYAEAMKINNEQPRRLLNRPEVSNRLGVNVEYPVTKVTRSSKPKEKNLIDVNANNFLPKLSASNTGNTNIKPFNRYTSEPMDNSTSYLDKYQMKPGFHFPDVQDKAGIAARHQLQIREIPKQNIKMIEDIDEQDAMATQKTTKKHQANTRLYPSDHDANSVYMPQNEEYHSPDLCVGVGRPQPSENYMPHHQHIMPQGTQPQMPYPPAAPRGRAHAYRPYPPKVTLMDVADVPMPEAQPDIEGAKVMPTRPSAPWKCGSEGNIQPCADNSQREGTKKKLPPLKKFGTKKRAC